MSAAAPVLPSPSSWETLVQARAGCYPKSPIASGPHSDDSTAGEALAAIDRDQAVATLHAVAAHAGALGSGSARERAYGALRSLGVRTWRRTENAHGIPLSILSAREREILPFLTESASNPEIASAVFLSRKSVERHVSNILRKLGVRNRTELASAVSAQMRDLPDEKAPARLLG